MEKRYQVFISSTFTDLENERKKIIETIMKLNCIPAAMELFPALDMEQLEFIKRVIDDCDYYVLIIGGKYGSVSNTGLSYTELEYDYAVSKGIRVIALLHRNPDEIPSKNVDREPETRQLLEEFRSKVSKGRLVEFWQTPEELVSLTATSLLQTIAIYPSHGWVRGSNQSYRELENRLIALTKKNQELNNKLRAREKPDILNGSYTVTTISRKDAAYVFGETGSFNLNDLDQMEYTLTLNWRDIFLAIAKAIYPQSSKTEYQALVYLNDLCISNTPIEDDSYRNKNVSEKCINEIRMKMESKELFKIKESPQGLKWVLSEKGRKYYAKLNDEKENQERTYLS